MCSDRTVRPLSGLVVLCRPEQMREAAVVLSCCPPGRFTPLIVVEPSPVSEDEYRARYAAYVKARDERDELVGTTFVRQNFTTTSDAFHAANAAVDAAAEALTPYRSWWRHQRMVAALLAQRPPERAILLFDPVVGDLDQLDAIPVSRIGDERQGLLPQPTKLIRLSTSPFAELPAAAWRACGHAGAVPEGIGVAGDEAETWFTTLARALRNGCPIRPEASPGTMPIEQGRGGEAVLVEVSDNAERLIAVQYALARDAKLVLAPNPPLGDIQAAVAAMQDVADGKLFGVVKEYLFGDTAVSDGLKRIEAAVNAAVPDRVVASVGGRDLTAFTMGVPYTFVRRRGADWSRKPIGHISGDATLLILTEMLGTPDHGDVGFSLIFDPGFFDTAETSNVVASLEGRVAHTVVVDGIAASGQTLIGLASLPLDVVYFNTHGSSREILLADGPLPAFKLQQRLRLRSRPFVFNSSCVSWVGVGREFVRIGARGYAGTLWSVNARHASDYAKVVLDRVTRQEFPFARAMRKTGGDRATELAYIYAGTVSSGLFGAPGERPAATEGDIPRRIARAARILLDRMGSAPGSMTGVVYDALDALLWGEASALMAEHAKCVPQQDADWVETVASQLQVISRWGGLADYAPAQIDFAQGYIKGVTAERIRQSPGQKSKLIEEGKARLQALASWSQHRVELLAGAPALYEEARRVLDRLTLNHSTRVALCAELTLQAGRVHLALNDSPRAVALLTESTALAGEHSARALVALSDALRQDRKPAEALNAATSARDAAGQRVDLRVGAIGRIAQLKIAGGDAEGALADAREGYALATELDDTTEREAFKGDEARAMLQLQRFEEAAKAARQCRALAHRSRQEEGYVRACGLLAGALIGLGEFTEASRLVDEGLGLALRFGFKREQGDFLIDRRGLLERVGDHCGAMQTALQATRPFVEIRDMDRVRNALGMAADSFNRFRGTAAGTGWMDALTMKARAELGAFIHVTPDLQHAIATEALGRFPELVESGPDEAIAANIAELADEAEAMLERLGAETPVLFVLARAYRTFERLAHGDRVGARAPASEADALTDGTTRLVALVDRLG